MNHWPATITFLVGSVVGASITAWAVRDTMQRVAQEAKDETSKAVERADKEWEQRMWEMGGKLKQDCIEQVTKTRGEMDAELEKWKKERKGEVWVNHGEPVAIFCADGGEPVQVGWSKGTGLRVRCYDAPVQGKPWGEKQ